MNLSDMYSINPRLVVRNCTDEILTNLKFSYTGIEKSPLKISKIYPGKQETKVLVADNLNKQTDLILSYEDTEDMVVYDKLIRNTNKTIILNLYKENGKLVVKTKIEDIKVKPTEFGSLIGKFYNIIIAILNILSAIIFIIQKHT